MIKAISYWSFPGGLENRCPIEDAITGARQTGFAGIELAIGETGVLTVETDEKTCDRYRKLASSEGVALQTAASAISWQRCLTDPSREARQRNIALHKKLLQRAAWLGVQSVLVVPGAVKIPWDPGFGPVRYDRAVDWAKEALHELAATAEQVNVELCVENVWNGLFYSPLELAAFVDAAESPAVGIYFDVGNVLGYHQHPPHWIEILGKRIRRVHIKDFKTAIGNLNGMCDLLDGDVPWAETMSALRAIGYDRTVVAEMMPWREGLLEQTSRAMDVILGKGQS
jgi:L-ribulose-5-phosphate 3-epimerase